MKVRFLKLVDRAVQEAIEPTPEFSQHDPQIDFDRKAPAAWQEAIECDAAAPAAQLGALETAPLKWTFAFPAKEDSELVRDASGRLVGSDFAQAGIAVRNS